MIQDAIIKGAKFYASISGGKDGQAMVKYLAVSGYEISGLVHADLKEIEWSASLDMCRKSAEEFNLPLSIVTRRDGQGMVERWEARMEKLAGTNKPFWSSSANRYCTSDLKRDPIDTYFRSLDSDFIISCEGIRGQESTDRAKKARIEIRRRITSTFYDGMTVEEAIQNYTPGKRLALTWYPIFDMTLEEVWATYGMDSDSIYVARFTYKFSGKVPAWWPFHPAYAYGNDRVSCMFCVLGSLNDLRVAAEHNPALLLKLIAMEEISGATFKNGFSLKSLL